MHSCIGSRDIENQKVIILSYDSQYLYDGSWEEWKLENKKK